MVWHLLILSPYSLHLYIDAVERRVPLYHAGISWGEPAKGAYSILPCNGNRCCTGHIKGSDQEDQHQLPTMCLHHGSGISRNPEGKVMCTIQCAQCDR